MPQRRNLLLATVLPIVLAACNAPGDAALKVLVIGGQGDLLGKGVRLPPAGQLLRGATTEGLVSFDAEGRIIPALADRWIVTDDGLSFIFRLRDGTWPDGTALSGDTARDALRTALAGLRGTALALDLDAIEDVRAMAGRVVEVRLSRPSPDLLQLLAQPELGLTRRGRGAGPMAAKPTGEFVVLAAIPPEDRGLPKVPDWHDKVRSIQLASVPGRLAVASFDEDRADVVLGGSYDQLPRAVGGRFLRGALKMDAVLGLFGLKVERAEGFLSDRANREALAMAIDRDAIGAALGLSGWTATSRIVSPGAVGDPGTVSERWDGMSLAARRDAASARVRKWRSANPDAPALRISLPGGPGADLLFGRLESDFRTIGIAVQRVAADAPADLRVVDQVARYPRAIWFLNQLSCPIARGPCSSSADTRLQQAKLAADEAGRNALLAEAEREQAATNVYIPFGVPVRWSLANPRVTGFSINRWAVHPLMPMATRPK